MTEPVEGYLNGEIPDDALNNSRVVGSSNAPVEPEGDPMNDPEQDAKFASAMSRAAKAQAERRARRAANGPNVKSKVQESTEKSAAANAAAVAVESTPPPDDDDVLSKSAFDPNDHTVAEVVAHVEANPDDIDAVLTAEKDGKARAGVLALTRKDDDGDHDTNA